MGHGRSLFIAEHVANFGANLFRSDGLQANSSDRAGSSLTRNARRFSL
jgi:hypothetical protein